MSSSHPVVSLAELCEAIVDCEHKTAPLAAHGHPSIRTTDIKNGRIDFDGANRVSEQTYRSWTQRLEPEPGDLILAREAPVGEVGIIPEGVRPCLGQRTVLLRPNSSRIVPRYLMYMLVSPGMRHALTSRAEGCTVPHLNVADIRQLPIPEPPPLPEQQRTADTLGALDDKIELNRRMNSVLESIARAIFKSWFVDFDPVRKKMEGGEVGLPPDLAARVPDQMDGGTGVASGWRRGCLQDLVETMLGGDWGLGEPGEDCAVRVNCLRGADIPAVQEGGIGNPPVRFLKPRSFERRRLRSGDLVVEVSGGSPTQSTGRCALVTNGVLARFADRLVCSNFCRVIRFTDPTVGWYVYFWLRWVYDRGLLFDFENGTTGIKNLAIADFALEPMLPLPPAEVLWAFNRQIEACLRLRESLSEESERLSCARDEFLPRLMDGFLRTAGPQ